MVEICRLLLADYLLHNYGLIKSSPDGDMFIYFYFLWRALKLGIGSNGVKKCSLLIESIRSDQSLPADLQIAELWLLKMKRKEINSIRHLDLYAPPSLSLSPPLFPDE